jgi:hypothetical protein
MSVPPAVRRHSVPLGGLVVVAVCWALFNLRAMLDQWSTSVPMLLDNRFQAWVMHWVQGAALGEHALYDATTFVPAVASLTFSDHLIGLAGALLPLRLMGLGPAAVFNTGIVVGVAIDAIAGYVLGLVLTRRRVAAVVAGAVYAIGLVPWLATMHINLVWRAGLPLVLAVVWLVADRAAKERHANDRWLLAGLAAVVAWQGLVSFFYAVFVIILAAIVTAVRWRDLDGRRVGVLAAVGAGTVVSAASYLPYLGTRSRHPDYRFRLDEIAFLRAAPHIVEDDNLLWGGALGRPAFGRDGFPAFPGVVVISLVVLGVAMVPSWKRRHGGAGAVLGLTVTGVGALGALGPGEGAWREWTPFSLAFRFVPGFSAIRASGRFTLIALLGLSVLAALGIAAAADRWDRRTQRPVSSRGRALPRGAVVGAVAAVVVAGTALEGIAGARDVSPARTHAVDDLVDEQPPGGVLYLPIGFSTLGELEIEEDIVYRSTAHDRPMPNGYAGYYPPTAFELAEVMAGLPSDERALDCLAAFDIDYVVVTERAVLSSWEALLDPTHAGPLEHVATLDGEVLYRTPARDASPDDCDLVA